MQWPYVPYTARNALTLRWQGNLTRNGARVPEFEDAFRRLWELGVAVECIEVPRFAWETLCGDWRCMTYRDNLSGREVLLVPFEDDFYWFGSVALDGEVHP